jgi:hypothetical protein
MSKRVYSIATEAYTIAHRSLQKTLSRDELSQIQATSSVKDLHDIATKTQNLSRRGTGRIRNMVQTLDQYSGVLDIVSQWHPEYSALVWGSIKWLLLVAMNYINLTQRIAAMLEEIGDNLPRFLLYQQLWPTSRMSKVLSKLYAAIIEFLYCTITYFHRRRIRRYFPVLWTPFETRFKETMEKIQRLQVCAGNDASATAMARQQAESTSFAVQLSELTIATKHMFRSILEVKQRQTAILLMSIRQDIFAGCDHHFVYQQEILDVYTNIIASDWQIWVSEEVKYVAGYRHEWTGLTYVQTESLQPTFVAGIISGILKTPYQPPTSFLFWSPGMTQESALACVIFQLLNRYAEKLVYRMAPTFYAEKFRGSSLSVESLWQTLLHIITALSGIRCLFFITSSDVEALKFARRLVEFGLTWTQTPCNLLVFSVTDSKLSDTPGLVELDLQYDVAKDLDSCEALSKVIWMELGIHKGLSNGMRVSVWSTLWRTLRYNAMALANEVVMQLIESRLILSKKSKIVFQRRLKRKIISFLLFLPLDIPRDIYEHLFSTVQAVTDHGRASPSVGSCLAWRAEPLDSQQRSACWAVIRELLEVTILGLFEERILNKLDEICDAHERQLGRSALAESIGLMDVMESIFAVDSWDTISLFNVRHSLERSLAKAIEFGLLYILQTARSVSNAGEDGDPADIV